SRAGLRLRRGIESALARADSFAKISLCRRQWVLRPFRIPGECRNWWIDAFAEPTLCRWFVAGGRGFLRRVPPHGGRLFGPELLDQKPHRRLIFRGVRFCQFALVTRHVGTIRLCGRRK